MPELAEYLRDWSPAPVVQTDQVRPWPLHAFAALLDQPSPLDEGAAEVPPLWHWFSFLDPVPQAELGSDGHPAGGGFLPPIPRRRRMFAGGRWWEYRPPRVGETIRRHTEVSSVRVTSGRSGELAFVTVRGRFFLDGGAAEPAESGELLMVEEQDLVYRSGAPSQPSSADAPVEQGAPPAARHELVIEPTETVLFRFSALTYNAHRIHYDLPYATDVEGYPGLVVHGPLLALLALELPRRYSDRRVTEFQYRLRRPAFAGTPIRAWSAPISDEPTEDGEWELAAGAVSAPPSLTATARLAGSVAR